MITEINGPAKSIKLSGSQISKTSATASEDSLSAGMKHSSYTSEDIANILNFSFSFFKKLHTCRYRYKF